jgi:Tfp pilus assembly protein PilN
MRAVNLLPRDEHRARLEGKRAPVLVAAGGIGVVTVAAALLGLSASGSAGDKRAELKSVNAAIARLPKAQEPTVSNGTIAQERTDRIAALSAALSTRIPFDRLFRQIAAVLPEDAWLTGLKATAPTSLSPAAGTSGSAPALTSTAQDDVTIAGATYSQDSVVRVLSRLAIVPALQDVRLTSSALVEPQSSASQTSGSPGPAKKSGRKVVTFTINASLRTGASP